MNFSIKYKFLIPTLSLIIVGLGVLAMVSYTKSKTALQGVINDQISQIANSTQTMIESWTSGCRLDVKTWSIEKTYEVALEDSFLGKSARKTASAKLSDLVEEYGYYENIAIVDSKGDLIASADPDAVGAGAVNVADRDYFKAAIKGEYTMGEVVKSKNTGKPVIIFSAPVKQKNTITGILMAVVKLDAFSRQFLDPIKIGKQGYAYLMDKKGLVLAYPDKSQIYKLDLSKFDFGKQILAKKNGQLEYVFKSVDKVAVFKTFEHLGCTLVITASSKEVFSSVASMGKINSMVAGVVLLAALIVVWLTTGTVVKPINKVVDGLKDAAEGEGDLTKRLEVKSKDEVGSLAKWFNVFVKKLQGIIADIAGNSEKLSSASDSLLKISKLMSAGAEQMSSHTGTVAAAAEEMSSNMTSVAAAAEESSQNINMVSAAVEEMTSTINEIAGNTEKTRASSNQAVNKTKDASVSIDKLSSDAMDIGRVVETINDISEQTNLLALNATIEAARAGEAGKGFAVVASEIKGLAQQTAEATLEIKSKIEGIQGSTNRTVSTIGEVIEEINSVNQMIDTVAAAVEEQSATTKEIALNITQAAKGIQEVTENVTQSSTVANEISQDVAKASQAADEMYNNSSQVNDSADSLDHLSQELKKTVNQFKI